ncbi:hypothetical protein ACMXYV_08280 [Neptuniibacter sp. SY11_33]|uniref:hypothetical protein n=1 Tax=Neptuniibacter sp. SY11_33 TaxID=3398215 RepID=UPI0039F60492
MSGKLISAICFKLFAIYFIVMAVVSIPSIWGLYATFPDLDKTPTLPAIVTAITLIVAWLMTRKLWSLSNSVIEQFPDTDSPKPDLEEVLLSVLGVFFIVSAISQLPTSFIGIWSGTYVSVQDVAIYVTYLIGPSVELIAGILLAFRASGISYFLTKLRRAGV